MRPEEIRADKKTRDRVNKLGKRSAGERGRGSRVAKLNWGRKGRGGKGEKPPDEWVLSK